jgi:hypothetical protein
LSVVICSAKLWPQEGDAKLTAISENVADFMRVLALCHGIVPSVDEDGELVPLLLLITIFGTLV